MGAPAGKSVQVAAAIVLAAASTVALAWTVGSAEPAVQPVQVAEPHLRALHARAADAAQWRRVLVIHHEPGKDAYGRILESGRTAGGWDLFPAAPPGAEEFGRAVDRLASAAAADYAKDRRFDSQTLWALCYFDVALICVEDGRYPVPLEVDEDDARLRPRGFAVELRDAQPVWHVVGEPEVGPDGDPVAWARGVRKGSALFGQFEDRLWGMAFTLESHGDADFLVAAPADGGIVLVNGVEVEPGRAGMPLVKLSLPPGPSRVQVIFQSPRGEDWVAILGALGVAISAVWLLRLFRPRLERGEPSATPPPGEAAADED